MTTPNNMPKHPRKAMQVKILSDLIATSPTSWTFKSLSKDEEGKEQVESKKVDQQSLRNPLAANMSAENVDRLAKRWLQ